MTGCHLKGIQGVYKPRSRVGLGKGSHSTSQRLVEALAQTCAKTKRTYGLCTSKGKAHVQGVAGRQRLQLAKQEAPLPPAPYGSVAGVSLNFSPVFNQGVV
jgi:ribose 5-phosphate isomerase